jgi:CHAT domain
MPADEDAADGRQGPEPRLPRAGRRRVRTGPPEEGREEDKELVRERANKALSHYDTDTQQKLPHPMAELFVFPLDPKDRSQGFGLRGSSCCGIARNVHDPARVNRDPGLSIDRGIRDVRQGGMLPDQFVLRMNNWSQEQVYLRDWLNECRRAHGGQLELVIWDDTEFRIPWELLLLPPSSPGAGGSAERLGAVATVTRWLSLHQSATAAAEVKMWDNEDPYEADGAVIAFIADDMAHDKSLFDGIVMESADSMSELFSKLKTSDPRAMLALVYVACHGEFSGHPDDCVLGDFPLGLTAELNHDLIRVREVDTLVFLNGCNTGSIAGDGASPDEQIRLNKGSYNDGALRGFAKFFLLSGAASVLATTGAVGKEDAKHVAAELLKYVKAHPEMPVAEAVRHIRANAAKRMTWDLFLHSVPRDGLSTEQRVRAAERRRKANETLHELLFPFMYVCFGSPRMLLALTAREGPSDTGELTGTGG